MAMPVTKTALQRTLRGLLFLTCFAAVLLLAGVAALYFLVTPERVTTRLTQVVERELGLELRLSSPPEIRHLPELVLTLPEATLLKPGHDEWQISFKQASIALHPLAIFAQSPKIRELRLKDLALALPETEFFTRLNKPYLVSTVGFDMDAFVLENASLTLLSETPILIKDLTVHLTNLSETGAQSFLSGHYERAVVSGAFQFSGNARWPMGLGELSIQQPLFEFKGLDDGVEREWRWAADTLTRQDFRTWNATHPDLRFRVDNQTLIASANLLSITPEAWTSHETTLTTDLPFGGEMLSWRITGNPERNAKGFFHWPDLRITASNNTHRTDLSGAFSLSEEKKGRIALSGSLFGAPTKFEADITPAFSETVSGVFRPRLEGFLQLGAQDPTFWRSLERRGFFSLFDFSGSLSLAGLTNDTSLCDLRTDVSLLNGNLVLTNAQAKLFGGNVRFTAQVQRDGRWQVEGNGEELALDAFLTRSFGRAPIEGRGRVHGEANGSLTDEKVPANVTVDVEVADATLIGLDLDTAYHLLLEERSDTLPAEILAPNMKTPVTTLSFRLEGRPQDLFITNGRMEGDGWIADFGGSLPSLRPEWQGTFRWAEASPVPALTLPWRLEQAPEATSFRWDLSWASTASIVRNALGEDSWSIDSIKRRTRRVWRNFVESVENYDLNWDKVKHKATELWGNFVDWLPIGKNDENGSKDASAPI